MRSAACHIRLAKRCAWALTFASVILVLTTAPVGAASTTTITAGECDLQTGLITVTWSGKDPFSYSVEFNHPIRGPFRSEVEVNNAADKANTLTVTEPEAIDRTPVSVTLFGKPHGNDFIGHFGTAPILDQIIMTCS